MKKYLKYLNYVIKHKWFVFIECCKVGCIWRGITHDLSKFRPSEFIPYAKYFYGSYPDYNESSSSFREFYHGPYKDNILENFNLAWLKHIHRNPHHWQHWLLQEDGNLLKLDMTYEYIDEMISDWKGAGRAITGKNDPKECQEWYLKNYNKIKISDLTRKYINSHFRIADPQLDETIHDMYLKT